MQRYRIRNWLVYALALVGLGALLWAGYMSWLAEPVELLPDRLSVDVSPATLDSATTLAAHVDAPLLEGNRVELLSNGVEIFPAMLDSIREARESVNMLTYVYWTGDIAREFAHELGAAARRGVDVRVLIDAYGGRKIDPELVEQMRAAGCEVAWFHPLSWYNLRRVNNRTHRKVLVVDGRVGYTGGVGIAEEWSGDAQDPQHWRDDHFRLRGPVVRYLQGSFAENWRQATGEVLAGDRMFPPLEAAGQARTVPLSLAPAGAVSKMAFAYWLLFNTAREEVVIVTPYFVPDPQLEASITAAARRGVRVTLLVPGPYQDSRLAGYAAMTYYRRLLQAGVRLFEYRSTMLHSKLVTVDDAWAVIGSPNFDSRSFELNYEVAVAVYDREFVEVLNASIAQDLRRTRQITLDEVDDWPAWIRLRNYTALLLREQL